MAPEKPNKQTQPEILSATKAGKNRVIKRPARGYHRFRNGVMNVAPKGAERKLVKENQSSPLLRLPSEIRDCIWKHVLGGKVFFAITFVGKYRQETYRFAPSVAEPSNGMALIRTCRQIYSEAVLYPLNMTTFACDDVVDLKRSVRALKTYQRKHITHLRLDCAAHNTISWLQDWEFANNNLDLNKTFPALARITVLIHGVTDGSTMHSMQLLQTFLNVFAGPSRTRAVIWWWRASLKRLILSKRTHTKTGLRRKIRRKNKHNGFGGRALALIRILVPASL